VLVLKLELWPKGDQTRAREIGRTYICNEGGSLTRGDYGVHVCRRGKLDVVPRDNSKGGRQATVKGYPRLRFNVWRLVLRSLLAAFPEER
jgi:hypothetical protein